MIIAGAVTLGGLTGLHAATWGAYKDSPFEGFRPQSLVRSILLGAAIAAILATTTAVNGVTNAVVALGVVYALERLSTEWWKAIVREDDQDAYSIPMRLGVRGRPIDERRLRYTAGLLVAAVLVLACWAGASMQQTVPSLPSWLVILTFGGAGGWATAIGGAWKDAPIEGFSAWKFLRSPTVATAWAVPLSLLTGSWVLLSLTAGGFAVATIETYKTFLTGGRAPGKFAKKPIRFQLPATRDLLASIHVCLWFLVAVAILIAALRPTNGLSQPLFASLAVQLPAVLLTLVAAAAAGLGNAAMRGHSRLQPVVVEANAPVDPAASDSRVERQLHVRRGGQRDQRTMPFTGQSGQLPPDHPVRLPT